MKKINTSLYYYDGYYNFLKTLLSKNQLPQSIIINGEEGSGKKTFLSKFLVDHQLAENNQIYNEEIDYYENLFSNKYQNIRVIKAIDDSIGINEIRELIVFCNQRALNGKKKFILINNIENLTLAAINSLLKLLENPPSDTFLFLLKNSEYKVNETIMSRCFKLNIKFKDSVKREIFKKLLLFFKITDFYNTNVLNDYDSPGLKIKKILYLKENKIENFSLKKIILFSINDFRNNKNFSILRLAGSFAKNYFYLNYKNNFVRANKFYNFFRKSFQNSLLYNSDIGDLSRKI